MRDGSLSRQESAQCLVKPSPPTLVLLGSIDSWGGGLEMMYQKNTVLWEHLDMPHTWHSLPGLGIQPVNAPTHLNDHVQVVLSR